MTENGQRALRLVEHYAVPTGKDQVQIRTATRTLNLKGAIVRDVFPMLFPLLDATRTVGEVVAALSEKIPEAKARGLVQTLLNRGLIEHVTEPPPGMSADEFPHYETMFRYCETFLGDRYAVPRALRAAKVLLVGGGVETPYLVEQLVHGGVAEIALRGDGVVSDWEREAIPWYADGDVGRPRVEVVAERLDPERRGASLTADGNPLPDTVAEWRETIRGYSCVVVTTNVPAVLDDRLRAINEAAIAEGIVWTTVAFVGNAAVQIGPTIAPEMTSCWTCMAELLERQVGLLAPAVDTHAMAAHARGHDAPLLPAQAEVAASMAAAEVIRAVSPGQDSLTYARVHAIRLDNFETSFYDVLKLPRCSACGPLRNRPRIRIWSPA